MTGAQGPRGATGAHPRRCGADNVHRLGGRGRQGSSPQVRGRSVHVGVFEVAVGLIPAGAGQMPGNSRSYRAVTAHPRRCGADIFPASRLAITWGSSPQVRGRLEHSKRRPLGGRLIPAGAGQISTTTLTPVMDSAHPRRCGADWRYPPSFSALHGSSPQVRGRFWFVFFRLPGLGLIPAGAGQMSSISREFTWYSAHPRRCGADSGLSFLDCLL